MSCSGDIFTRGKVINTGKHLMTWNGRYLKQGFLRGNSPNTVWHCDLLIWFSLYHLFCTKEDCFYKLSCFLTDLIGALIVGAVWASAIRTCVRRRGL